MYIYVHTCMYAYNTCMYAYNTCILAQMLTYNYLKLFTIFHQSRNLFYQPLG